MTATGDLDPIPRNAATGAAPRWRIDDLASLARALRALEARMDQPPRQRSDILRAQLIVEELAVNALTYASDTAGPILLELEVEDAAEGAITMQMPGPEFDPTDPGAVPDTEPDEIGGNGLRIVQGFARNLQYRFQDGMNHVRFTV